MPIYDAFISYSHASDSLIASRLQSQMQRLGKPWYQRRALRIFRDDTSLSATPGLAPSLDVALGQSRFLVLLASIESARSRWVSGETLFWLNNKTTDSLLIVLTSGDLSWDERSGDFAWSDQTPLPSNLKGKFRNEPRWVDLRGFRDASLTADKLLPAAADLASAIHGIPKEDLLSQELIQQRRAKLLAWSAAASLLVLACAAAWEWRQAVLQRDRAENTLQAAIEGTKALVLEVGVELRQTVGIPLKVVDDIMATARELQAHLLNYNANSQALRRAQAVTFREQSQTLYAEGKFDAALEAAKQSRDILQSISPASGPASSDFRRELSLSDNRIGEAYSRCPPRIKRALDRGSLSAIVLLLESETEKSARGNLTMTDLRRFIFDRLNTGGTKLNPQEIRNALNPGPFNKIIIDLTRFRLFTEVFDIPPYVEADPNEYYENPMRQSNALYASMGDCQLVLRYFALKDDQNIRGSMRAMLDRAMQIQISEVEGERLKEEYQERFSFLYDLFDKRPFLLPPDDKGRERIAAANSATLLLAATFEEFIREMALSCAKLVIGRASKFEDLPRNLASTAWRRTLETLARIDVGAGNANGPRDAELSQALARFSAVYQFCNGDLSQDIYADLIHNENNMRPQEINALFKLSNVIDICSKISDKVPLMENFGENEPGKAHGKLLKYLNEFFERRNEIAHSLRLARSIGPAQILQDVEVFEAVGRSLAETMNIISPKAVPPPPVPKGRSPFSWLQSWMSPASEV